MGRLPTDASGGGRGGRSPAARPTARPAAVSRAAKPALRPGLTGTRRRKRRRGPFGPEVDQSSTVYRREEIRGQENTFARGAAPSGRHPAQRRGSASSARPHARNEADTCARGRGRGERTWVPGRVGSGKSPVRPGFGLDLDGSTPNEGRSLHREPPPRLREVRTKSLVPPSVCPSMLVEPARMGGRSCQAGMASRR